MKKVLLFFILICCSFIVFAQETQNKEIIPNFSGVASVTNKGISIIPLFTLGKPAMVFEMSMGNRLTFDPLIRAFICKTVSVLFEYDLFLVIFDIRKFKAI